MYTIKSLQEHVHPAMLSSIDHGKVFEISSISLVEKVEPS